MESPLQAPAVVAVVVTCDSGSWLEEALEALAAQDYPNLSVLVIDANSAEDPTHRVARVLPDAFVRRLPANRGYAASANEALKLVEGASLYLLCHDDVVPAPDAVRIMVEEAFRSNAGIVAPKLLDWHEPARLLQVGMGADRGGAPVALAERGELDQSQHDNVRDVFFAPGGCVLVRADLFASLGGFDPLMGLYGEDLDLSWRAHIVGARVVVAPAARVRHLEAMSTGRRAPGGGPTPNSEEAARRRVRPLQLRHRLRAVLKAYGPWHLIRVLPQAGVLALLEIVADVLTGRAGAARDTLRAWSWNLRHLGQLRAARRQVHGHRRMSDSAIRDLQARDLTRFVNFVRTQVMGENLRPRAMAGRVISSTRARDLRLPLLVGAGATVLFLFGSRQLLTGGVPAVNELAPVSGGPVSLLRGFLSSWREVGLGAEGPAPPAFVLLGLGGVLLGGSTALLQTVLVVAALPLGAVGAFRLARPFGSQRGSLAALVVYAAVPVAYNAFAAGRVSGLVAYAAAPWVLSRLLRVTGIEPFGDEAPERSLAVEILGLGVLLAVAAALSPSVTVMAILAALGIVVGAALGGGVGPARRALAVALGGAGVSAVLLFPWTLTFLRPGARLSALMGETTVPAGGYGWGSLLRFQTGALGDPPFGWAFVVAGALPLLIGREWRLSWAARLWGLAIASWAAAWLDGRGWLPIPLPPADVILAPAALALALAVALGMTSFEVDLRGYRFGWRQLASICALVATLAGALPVLATAIGGRWGLPRQDFAELLSWMPEQRGQGSFRVLWLGDPEALPVGAWRLEEGLSYGTSRDGPPDVRVAWAGASPGPAEAVAEAFTVARSRGTTRLGRLLAPMAVRYVVVPERAAPSQAKTPLLPPPSDVPATLDAQVDLKQLKGDSSLRVYENAAWAPGRALLGPEQAQASRQSSLESVASVNLSGSRFALPEQRSRARYRGPVQQGDVVFLSEASSRRWQLRVGGRAADRTEAFGWANAFTAPASGPATLRYHPSFWRYLVIAVQVILWLAAIHRLVAVRRLVARRRSG
ncbi:MAG: glycosyltransferase [Actinomycetota bacterium]|nr:glycosyltransferase [Actinomycetota bacterium]